MAKNKVLWTETAKADLNEIIDYIASDSVDNALKQYENIKPSCLTIIDFPEQGRMIPELENQNIMKYREIVLPPWLIMYKKEKNIIYVMSIIDGRRNIEDLLLRRNLRY